MAAQFEFRLKGGSASDGELDADHLVALVQSLTDVASRIGRAETAAEPLGRAPHRVHRVADLVIGLAPGSTRLLVRRAGASPDTLDIELSDERAFDERFEALFESLADGIRPPWVGESLAGATDGFAGALRRTAPEVEFRVDGHLRRAFPTAQIDRARWQADRPPSAATITFVGRLYGANLNTHRLLVQDDVGHKISLPEFRHDAESARLLGAQVAVTGVPVLRSDGSLDEILDATIISAPPPFDVAEPIQPVSVIDLLETAPGPSPDDAIELSDEEFAAFLEAARG